MKGRSKSSEMFWKGEKIPASYPEIRYFCLKECNQDYPDLKQKKCRECFYAQNLKEVSDVRKYLK